MTTPQPAPDGIRPDVAWVEIDGEVVVYDPAGPSTHLLGGGAAIVWQDVAESGRPGAEERIAALVGADVATFGDEVRSVLDQLRGLGLLTADHDGDDDDHDGGSDG